MTLMLDAGTITAMVTRIGPKTGQHLYLAEWREHFGLTIEQVAGRVGVSRQTIWRWENGLREPSRARLAALAYALNEGKLEQFWRPPDRPSVDALLKDASKEDFDTAVDVVKRILKRAG
jgi:transcriptional regulator with XRE-family HTH domain